MRIASVVCAYPPYSGGIGNSAYEINKHFAKKHEVNVFEPGNLKPWFRSGHAAFAPGLLFRLSEAELIYFHYPFFGTDLVIFLYMLFHRKKRLVIHYHMDVSGLPFFRRLLSLPSRLVRGSLMKMSEKIIVSSLDYAESSAISGYYRRHPEKFIALPFGVDLSLYRPKPRAGGEGILAKAQAIVDFVNEKFIKKDRLNLLFVGGLDRAHYFKGVDVLLRSLAEADIANWQLEIVGEGDLKPTYETLARDLGIDKRVNFRGRLSGSELIRAYQNAELFILPSINGNEAFGIVLIEALACGLPVIASELPGVRRVFEDHVQGLLIRPGDISDLRQKLEFVARNDKMRRLMSVAARRLAEEKYDLEKMSERLEALI